MSLIQVIPIRTACGIHALARAPDWAQGLHLRVCPEHVMGGPLGLSGDKVYRCAEAGTVTAFTNCEMPAQNQIPPGIAETPPVTELPSRALSL